MGLRFPFPRSFLGLTDRDTEVELRRRPFSLRRRGGERLREIEVIERLRVLRAGFRLGDGERRRGRGVMLLSRPYLLLSPPL